MVEAAQSGLAWNGNAGGALPMLYTLYSRCDIIHCANLRMVRQQQGKHWGAGLMCMANAHHGCLGAPDCFRRACQRQRAVLRHADDELRAVRELYVHARQLL